MLRWFIAVNQREMSLPRETYHLIIKRIVLITCMALSWPSSSECCDLVPLWPYRKHQIHRTQSCVCFLQPRFQRKKKILCPHPPLVPETRTERLVSDGFDYRFALILIYDRNCEIDIYILLPSATIKNEKREKCSLVLKKWKQ